MRVQSLSPVIFRRHHKPVTESTNLDARAGRAGDVFTADVQTAGRGRLDHKWLSAPGANLTFSVVLDVASVEPATAATLPLVVGYAVVRALGRFVPAAGLRLKWPNDVLWDGRKICGILCERQGDDVIAGVGVNVNQTEFPAEIAARATSLRLIAGPDAALRPNAVLDAVLAELDGAVTLWREAGFAAILPRLAPFDALKGRVVSIRQTDDDGAPFEGLCGGINPDGSLDVAGRAVYAGEAGYHACNASLIAVPRFLS